MNLNRFFVVFILIVSVALSHPADPNALLTKYALYGEDSLVFMGKGVTPESGWVGTKGTLYQNGNYDDVVYNSIVKVGDHFEAGNEAKTYNDSVYVKGTVSGAENLVGGYLVKNASFTDPVLPTFTADQISVGTEDVVTNGQNMVLEPGQYRTVTVASDGDVLTLGPGIYEMDSLVVRGVIHVKHDTPGITRILVRTQASFINAGGTNVDLICDSSALGKVLLYCAGTQDSAVVLDDHEEITATVVAPFSNLNFQTHAVVKGQIHAKSIKLSVDFSGYQSSFIAFNPGSLIFPQWVLDGVPEDSLNDPASRNSYQPTFPLAMSEKLDVDASLQYEILKNGTSTLPATEGSDFSLDSAISRGTLTFVAGDTVSRETISFWVEDDTEYEPQNEYVTVRLFSPDSVTFSNGEDTIEYQIPIVSEDLETTIPYEERVVFPESILAGVEEDRQNDPASNNSYLLSFSLGLEASSNWNGSVQYEILETAQQTPAATDVVDFIRTLNGASATGTVTFSAGSAVSSDSIHIWIVDDSKIESNEYISIRLFNPDSVTLPNGTNEQFYSFAIISEDDSTADSTDTTGNIDPTSTGLGALYDLDGDGLGDYVSLTIQSETRTVSEVLSVEWKWPVSGTVETVDASLFTNVNDSVLNWSVNSVQGSGEGEATVTYDDSLQMIASLIDSVGPALVNGFSDLRNSARTEDTVTIVATESFSVVQDEKWLILFDDSAAIAGDTVQVLSAVSSGATSWKITLPKGTVRQGMWVQLNSNSSVQDSRGNGPLSINQKVELLVEMSTVPQFSKAVIYDRFGENGRRDGYGDSGFVSVSLAEDSNRVTMQDLQELIVETPSGTVAASWTFVDDSTIVFADSTLSEVAGSAGLELRFSSVSVSGSFTDSVAPAVVQAIYERWDSGDTLEITFTEPLSNAGNGKPFLFVSGADLQLSARSNSGTTVRYAVTGPALGESDSLWIDPTGSIIDTAGNEQLWLNNRQVPVKILQIVNPVEAWFKDTDLRPDGIADQVTIVTSMPIPAAMYDEILANITLPAMRGTATSISGTDSTLVFTIQPIDSALPNSAVSGTDIVVVRDVRMDDTLFHFNTALPIADSMAPVATKAVYRMGENSTSDSVVIDTLIVQFSEEIRGTNMDRPFQLSRDSLLYSFDLIQNLSGGTTVYYEREYRLNDTLPVQGDSLWIAANGGVEDRLGNEQILNTKPVEVEVDLFQTQVEVNLYPNPVYPNLEGFFENEYLASIGEEESRVILVVTPIGLRPLPGVSDLRAKIALFDVVGNVVFSQTELTPVQGNGRDMVFPFEIKNSNGRNIGTRATYLLQVELSGPFFYIRRLMLGVGEKMGTPTDKKSE